MSNTTLRLKTNRLLLRPMLDSDTDFVFQGLSHPEVIRYYAVSCMTLEETKTQMNWYKTIESEKTGQWWAICDQEDQHFFGAVGLHDIHPQHRRAEMGYWLLPDHWGNRIVPEAVEAVCRYGFDHMDLHRIYAYVEPENINSRRVVQKLNFTFEGTMKECEISNGQWIDLEMYAVLNPKPNGSGV